MSMVSRSSETVLFLGTPDEVTPEYCQCLPSISSTVGKVTRYLGSKASWSVVGSLLSAPSRAYNWVTGTPTPSSSYHLELENISPEQLAPYLRYAAANAATHTMDDGRWLGGFDGDKLRFRELSSLKVNVDGLRIHDDKIFFDLKTGFKATVAESPEEVIIAFGALDSLADVVWATEGGADLMERIKFEGENVELMAEKQRIMNKQASAKLCQKKVIASNLLGNAPEAYEQAAQLVEQLKRQFPGKKITLTGQCLGGSLASYAALKNDMPARCFNTLPLGAGCQQAIGDDVLAQADYLIEHVSASTDWISDNRKVKPFDVFLTYGVGIRTPGNFGKRFAIPSAYKKANPTHDYMLGSMLAYLMPDWRDVKGNNATRAIPMDFLKQEVIATLASEAAG